MSTDISIIIPIYNVEKYLSECLASVSLLKNITWEAILIDDGSTDGSALIAKKYANKDKRFKYLYQNNSGQGEARRKGIDISCGEYIFFLDSDDLIVAKTVEGMIASAKQLKSEIVISDYCSFSNEKEINNELNNNFKSLSKKYPGLFTRESVTSYHDFYRSIYFTVVWGKLFKRTLLNEIKFPPIQGLSMGEDLMMTKIAMIKATSISFFCNVSVNYRIRPGSVTNLKSKNSLNIFPSFKYIEKLYLDYSVPKNDVELLYVAYFDYFIEHFQKFTPNNLLYEYYLELIFALENYPESSIKRIRELSVNRKRVYLFKGGRKSFIYLFVDIFVINEIKRKIKKVILGI